MAPHHEGRAHDVPLITISATTPSRHILREVSYRRLNRIACTRMHPWMTFRHGRECIASNRWNRVELLSLAPLARTIAALLPLNSHLRLLLGLPNSAAA
jgi:hypothetical protein